MNDSDSSSHPFKIPLCPVALTRTGWFADLVQCLATFSNLDLGTSESRCKNRLAEDATVEEAAAAVVEEEEEELFRSMRVYVMRKRGRICAGSYTMCSMASSEEVEQEEGVYMTEWKFPLRWSDSADMDRSGADRESFFPKITSQRRIRCACEEKDCCCGGGGSSCSGDGRV